jgi:hypothetical protein
MSPMSPMFPIPGRQISLLPHYRNAKHAGRPSPSRRRLQALRYRLLARCPAPALRLLGYLNAARGSSTSTLLGSTLPPLPLPLVALVSIYATLVRPSSWIDKDATPREASSPPRPCLWDHADGHCSAPHHDPIPLLAAAVSVSGLDGHGTADRPSSASCLRCKTSPPPPSLRCHRPLTTPSSSPASSKASRPASALPRTNTASAQTSNSRQTSLNASLCSVPSQKHSVCPFCLFKLQPTINSHPYSCQECQHDILRGPSP